jgi:hypothetical protein
MRDPQRQREGSDERSSRVRELLARAEKPLALTPQQRARSSARVARLTAIPVGVAALGWFQSIAAAAAIGAGSAVVLLAGVAVVESRRERPAPAAPATSGTVAPARRSVPARQPPPPPVAPRATSPPTDAASPPPAVPAAVASSPETVPELPQQEETPPPPPPAPATVVAAPEGNSLVRETALLEEARVQLDRSPAEALTRLERYAREFPDGKLAMEGEFLTITALRRLGRRAEAQARAEALLSRSKASPYEERIRRMLDGGP